MPFDGAEGDDQSPGNLTVRQALGEQSQHLNLALAQGFDEVGGWRLEVGSWKLEVGGWKLEVGSWRLDD
jgi:hypothetical protein